MKIDLHCHSKYSKRPSLWLMQKIGCPESFTEPVELYRLARQYGMSAVTITDHNVIDGALEIAMFPDTFVSCEYTTYFPDDRCKVHVLAWDITEAQHHELSIARENIFDLVDYLHDHKIQHACAHPLFWVNDRLTVQHIEKLALLFKNWEWNGDLNPSMNLAVKQIIERLTPKDIERLIDKHNIVPRSPEPWRKNLTGGSDDHSSINLARTFTHVPHAESLEEFWVGLAHGKARVRSQGASPQLFARNVYGIAYQFYKNRFGLEQYVHKDIFLLFLDRALRAGNDIPEPLLARIQMFFAGYRRAKEYDHTTTSILDLARLEAEKLIRNDPQLMGIVRDGVTRTNDLDQKWYEFVNQVSNKMLVHFGRHLLDRVVRARIFDVFHSLGSAGALYALLAPYFVAYSLFMRERSFSQEVLNEFFMDENQQGDLHRTPKVAHFTDTFYEVNGVARTLQQQLATALNLGKDYSIITCRDESNPSMEGVYNFGSVGSFMLPEYPELKVLIPPFLQMLHHCYEENITHIHVSTPGPIGLAALGIARILRLPISGTYHTAIPQYVKALTDDFYIEDMSRKYILWYHNQLDTVFAPSEFTAKELIENSISEDKVRIYPRGIDTERFHPDNATSTFKEQYGIEDDIPVLLYVGRVSKEKNLDVLVKAYMNLLQQGVVTRLVITGDGPYREEMEHSLNGSQAIFTGYQSGDDLAVIYASSDLLVFPSTTDTFGNVVLEAQASGIPVVVSNVGGPSENLIPNETGIIVDPLNPVTLTAALTELIVDSERRIQMGKKAREYMENRGFHQAFEQLYAMYTGNESNCNDQADTILKASVEFVTQTLVS